MFSGSMIEQVRPLSEVVEVVLEVICWLHFSHKRMEPWLEELEEELEELPTGEGVEMCSSTFVWRGEDFRCCSSEGYIH